MVFTGDEELLLAVLVAPPGLHGGCCSLVCLMHIHTISSEILYRNIDGTNRAVSHLKKATITKSATKGADVGG